MAPVMVSGRTIRLTVPGSLLYRGVAVRAVLEACALVGRPPDDASAAGDGAPPDRKIDLTEPFDVAVVSAFGEIFNNIAIHGYADRAAGEIAIQVAVAGDHIAVEIRDQGAAFDLSRVPRPELEALPEGGMGIHIAKACVEELDYAPGPPNVWRMTKYVSGAAPRAPSSNQPL